MTHFQKVLYWLGQLPCPRGTCLATSYVRRMFSYEIMTLVFHFQPERFERQIILAVVSQFHANSNLARFTDR